MMTKKQINIVYTHDILFFLGWVVIFLLGADFPPPQGFWKVVLLVLILTTILHYYLHKLLPILHQENTFWLNLSFFFTGSLLLGCLTAIGQNHEPKNLLIWIGTLTTVGCIYGIGMFLFLKVLDKRKK